MDVRLDVRDSAPRYFFLAIFRKEWETPAGCAPVLTAPRPSYATLLAVDKTRLCNVGRAMRLAWALSRTRALREFVDETVDRCPSVRQALRSNSILFRPLTSSFLDARLTTRLRFKSYAYDLRFTSSRIHSAMPCFFPANLRAPLTSSSLGRDTVYLEMNLDHPQDGLWRLALHCPDGFRLFAVCFSVVQEATIFIAAVQGGRSSAASSNLDKTRADTREFEGLRPQCLLLEGVGALASTWQVTGIRGVSNRHQLTSCSKRGHAVRFSAATLRADGNWDVPIRASERQASTIPTRKRGMYRRRGIMRQELTSEVTIRLLPNLSALRDVERHF